MRHCANCGEKRPCDPISGLCVDCLIAEARTRNPPKKKRAEAFVQPRQSRFDYKARQAKED